MILKVFCLKNSRSDVTEKAKFVILFGKKVIFVDAVNLRRITKKKKRKGKELYF